MSILCEREISSLSLLKFYIPSYQRGYRWCKQQVDELLNDMNEFSVINENSWYCLQPVVVKKSIEKNDNTFEVIDGQQRLTTIFLMLHYLNENFFRGQNKEYSIYYETREKSTEFLNNLKVIDGNVLINDENIDYFHMSGAYKAIHEWVTTRGEAFDFNKFYDKLYNFSKVIWYEVEHDDDSIEIFTRINMGKIPLTSAELIKAIFLNSSNFTERNSQIDIKQRQIEIANEWDQIEYALQDDSFWYFLNRDENTVATRIEFIFDLINKLNYGNEKSIGQAYEIFKTFSRGLKIKNKNEIEHQWSKVKDCYLTLTEWYKDKELYHKIGYLISVGFNILDLFIEKEKTTKKGFKAFLNQEIGKIVNYEEIKELDYTSPQKVRNVLLLHNLETLLRTESNNVRFPFDKFKRDKWDIEHIHAVASQVPKHKQSRIDWVNSAKAFLDNQDLICRIETFVENYDNLESEFDKLSYDVIKATSRDQEEEVNTIGNLVLLDAKTNRSYKNAVFPHKRKVIIEKDKNGNFIPLCTKNVFLKYYNDDVSQMSFWLEEDRKTYLNNILETLRIYGADK